MKFKRTTTVLMLFCVISIGLAQMEGAVDDTTMSRLRLANLVFGSGATDQYVDGQIPLLGSSERELSGVPEGWIPGFLYLEPGTHTVAIVPTGKSLDEAMFALEVTLEPGHRYSVLAMGQKEDSEVTPLVIDETAALAEARTSPEQYVMIFVNNQKGAETVDFIEDGVGLTNILYGGFVAGALKAGHVDQLVVTVNGEVVENAGNFYELPGTDIINAINGSFQGVTGQHESFHSSDLNALELLALISDFDIPEESFDTFLSAVETAGLSDMLTAGTHFIFAPTDEAFEAMPAEQRETLMADPEALADFLRHHIVEGYYPVGSVSGAVFGTADITLTTMQGGALVLRGDVINGVYNPIQGHLVAANGTRVAEIYKVLLPPSQ